MTRCFAMGEGEGGHKTGFQKIFFVCRHIFFRCDLSVKVPKLIVCQFATKRPKHKFLSVRVSLCLFQSVYHWQFMSVTDRLFLLKTICVCHRESVCHRHMISVKICPWDYSLSVTTGNSGNTFLEPWVGEYKPNIVLACFYVSLFV